MHVDESCRKVDRNPIDEIRGDYTEGLLADGFLLREDKVESNAGPSADSSGQPWRFFTEGVESSTGSSAECSGQPKEDTCKPGFWDRADGTYKKHTTPIGMVSGERSFAPTDEATWPKHPLPCHRVNKPESSQAGEKWKPMSAVKLRAAAKQDEYAEKRRRREDTAEKCEASNAALWKDAFDADHPIPLDKGVRQYAAWVCGGRQGEDAKESAFVPCKNYKYRIGGPRRCKEGWVLKTGALGFGYYKDGVAERRTLHLHELLWPTEQLAPVVICLDEVVGHRMVIGDPLLATTEDHVEEETPKKRVNEEAEEEWLQKGKGVNFG